MRLIAFISCSKSKVATARRWMHSLLMDEAGGSSGAANSRHEEGNNGGPLQRNRSEELTYKKRGGCADGAGLKYEYKLASLFYLRGINHTDGFYLGTNVACAGAFDDLVFKYKPRGEQLYRTCFIQCKHNVKGSRIINVTNLADANDDHGIYKYYKSFREVKEKVNDFDDECVLFDVDFSRCDFIFYTNVKVERSLAAITTDESSLERAKIFATRANRIVQPATLNESKVHELKSKIKDSMEKPNVKGRLLQEFQGFRDAIESDMDDFLERFQWFPQQASEGELDDLIKEEINAVLKISDDETVRILKLFVEKMQCWWEEAGESKLLTETAHLWGDIAVSLLSSDHMKKKEMQALNIRFTEQEIDSFNQSLTTSHVINVTSSHIQLTGLKISQVLEKYRYKRFIFMDQEYLLSRNREVLQALKNTWCDVLVIECGTDAKSLADELSEASQGKKLIFLTEFALPGYHQLQDKYSWNQLETSSQKQILDKEVDFQGYEVGLRSVVGEHCTHALTGDVVTLLLNNSFKLKIGQKLPAKVPYYIPRSLERLDYVTNKTFKQNPGDYFIISNVAEQDVSSLESSYGVKLTNIRDYQIYVLNHFYYTDNSFTSSTFRDVYQKISTTQNVHWLSVDSTNRVYWKQSFKNMDGIKKDFEYLERNVRVEDVDEGFVLVTAEPGMGKTFALNYVAQAAKSADSSLWVIRINLNGVTRMLGEQRAEVFSNPGCITNILIELVKGSPLDEDILRSRLTLTGNVNVYLDGFDEISLDYKDKVTNMIKSIMQLKVEQVWLTSRNVMRHHLERELCSFCYSMKPFTNEDQLSFLVQYRPVSSTGQSIEISAASAQNILDKASESFSDRDRKFTGIPLQCMMLSEVFGDYVRDGELNLPKKIDLLQLFENFISKKFRILYEDKYHFDTTNALQVMEREYKRMTKNHSYAAIVLLLSDVEIKLIENLNKNKISKVASRVHTGKECTGLIDGIINGIPSFIHRCFAEYFLARRLSENIASSSVFIEKHLFEPRFDTVRQFFDRLLARDCPLHNAVLSADKEVVEALLTSGADVNHLDKEGRSAMHLAASYTCLLGWANDLEFDNKFSCNPFKYNNIIFDISLTIDAILLQILVDNGADISLTDKLLQYTPIRYADRTKAWGSVEILLKNGANTDDLLPLKREALNYPVKDIPFSSAKTPSQVTSLWVLISTMKDNNVATCEASCTRNLVENESDRFLRTEVLNTPAISPMSSFNLVDSNVDEAKVVAFGVFIRLVLCGCVEILKFAVDVCGLATNIDLFVRRDNLLHLAAQSGNQDSVKFLSERGADVKQRGPSSWLAKKETADGVIPTTRRPIHIAAILGHHHIIPQLIQSGEDVNVTDEWKYTPLHCAAGSATSNLETINCLLSAGADVNARTFEGHTPLFVNIGFRNLKVIQRLIEAGADPSTVDHMGITAAELVQSIKPEQSEREVEDE